ncbi:ankyrin repeat and KH domain-containing protein 1-like isoform X2 [Halichondria panicea]|uniref:ankyrin repeat and KH domain-containing protein 1-like isoform X2 n=1 Tax=Halichondria panicea TaxID=6063 RepID=UPI00312B5BA7
MDPHKFIHTWVVLSHPVLNGYSMRSSGNKSAVTIGTLGDDEPLPELSKIFPRPSWQLQACVVSVLINPLMYRVYQILVTIGYILCPIGTSGSFSASAYASNFVICPVPVVDLSWTGLFPCNLGWRGSALVVAIVSVVFLVSYLFIRACLTRWNPRRIIKQIVNCTVKENERKRERDKFDVSLITSILTPALSFSLVVFSHHLLLQCGDVESNPGPGNTGYKRMVSCAERIVEGLSRDPNGIAISLFSGRLISDALMRATMELSQTKVDKARRLYTTVLDVVKHYPERYDNFLAVFREHGGMYTDLLELLEIEATENRVPEDTILDIATENRVPKNTISKVKRINTKQIKDQWDELLWVVNERLDSKLKRVVITLKRKHSYCFEKLCPEIGSVEKIFYNLSKLKLCRYRKWNILQDIITAVDKDSCELLHTYELKYHGFKAVNKIADRLCCVDLEFAYSESTDEEMMLTNEISFKLAKNLKLTKRIDNPTSIRYIKEVWRECKRKCYVPSLRVMTDFILQFKTAPNRQSITLVAQTPPVTLEGVSLSTIGQTVTQSTPKPVMCHESPVPEDQERSTCIRSTLLSSSVGHTIKLIRLKTISEKLLAECRSETADIEVVRGYLEQEDCDVNIRENDDLQWSPLMWALEHKHFTIAKLLLKYKPQVNIQDKKEWSPLMLACRAGDLEIVQGIVALGAEIDLPTNKGWTPLMWAAYKGHAEMARFLLEKGAFVDFCDIDGATPLTIASMCGHVELVEFLLSNGADSSVKLANGQTVLHLAALEDYPDVVELLHTHNCELARERDQNDYSALMEAAAHDHVDVIRVLVSQQDDLGDTEIPTLNEAFHLALMKGHTDSVDRLLRSKFKKEIIDSEDSDGMTPLVLAVLKQSPKLVDMLMTAGADPNLANRDGMTPLMLAAEVGQVDSVKLLVEKGAEVTLPHEMSGKTALHFASENGHTDVVELLALPEHQALAIKDMNDKTALVLTKNSEVAAVLREPLLKQSWKTVKQPFQSLRKFITRDLKLITACRRGDIKGVKRCLQKKANVDALDILRWTGLMRAAHNGHDKVVKLMLEHGANPDIKTRTGWTALILASRKGYFNVVRHLVDHGADVSISNWRGWTALMAASQGRNTTEEAQQNKIKTAEIILDKDPSVVDIRAKDQWTPLMQACQDGNTGLVELLVEKGANTELFNPKNWTPLMIATTKDRVEVVKALVKSGAEVEHKNEEGHGMSALHVACVKGRDKCLRIMVESAPGAKCQVDLEIKDKWGMTPLMMAAKNGNEKCIEILVENEADVNTKSKRMAHESSMPDDQERSAHESSMPDDQERSSGSNLLPSILGRIIKPFRQRTISEKLLAECRSETADIEVVRGYLEQEDCDVNIRENDDFKWSPLMWACENKHFEIGRLLLKYHPQVHIQDKKEWSPLVLACRAGDLEIVQGIVALGAEIDLPTNTKWTPLMWAAQEGHAEMATFLLEKGAFVDFPDENGWTPVMQASQEGHVDVINVLLDHNAKVNHQTETTWCALMAAAKNMHSDAVDTLLKRGAQVDIQRDDGSTTLQVASYYKGNSAVMKTLIKHGANIDHLNKDGMSALMLATNKGHLGVVQDLIQGGADTNKQHPETGWTPIFFAAKSGEMDIFKQLLHKGARTEIEGRNVVDVASMFKREEMLSELKTFEQASHRIISSSVNPPSLEADEPTPVEQEPSITEPKVEIPPEEVTKPEQELAEDSTEEVIIEPPQLPDPEAVKPSLSTTEAEEKEVDVTPVPVVETFTVKQETKELSQMDTKATKEKTSEAKKSSKDIEKEAKIIELLLRGFANRMANPSSNKYRYEETNIADVIGGKGLKSSEEITHKLAAPEVAKHFSGTPSIQRAIAISEDPDDDLYI